MTLEGGSQIEITPEPTPEERAAILAALRQVGPGDEGVAAWWEAGLRENVEDDEG